jgi:hypothetical protein
MASHRQTQKKILVQTPTLKNRAQKALADCGAASLRFEPWETPASSMARRLADYISN